jgi:RNA polymerase sigma factor (sigma-70 family)
MAKPMSEDVENRGAAFAASSADAGTAAEDAELLRRYAETGAEEAFAEIVRRRIGLVYSVALRHTHDAHRAQEVAQRVFTDLARKARALAGRTVIVGWLYRSAQFAASNAVRTERRRQAREQEAYTMQQIERERPDPNWEKFRPVLDEVLNDMDERDRDAVLLRFFDGRGFAEIGAELRLTESAARMRVERALDKMHRALGRRGVTSTTAALGIALANQAGAALPAGLAANVAGTALANAAAGGGVAAAGGWALLSTKALLAGAGVIAALAIGSAVYQTIQLRGREAALGRANQTVAQLQSRVDRLAEQARAAERRAQEAEKDSGDLLKAVASLRAGYGPVGAEAAAVARALATQDQQRAAYERAFQDDVAKRRAAELKRRADLEDQIAPLSPAQKLNRLLEVAEALAARADYQQALRTLIVAATAKPAELPLPERFTQLQAELQALNAPIEVTLTSDDVTFVAVGGVRAVGTFSVNTVRLPPGDYEIIGWRTGYESVIVPLRLRAGSPPGPVAVSCTRPTRN